MSSHSRKASKQRLFFNRKIINNKNQKIEAGSELNGINFQTSELMIHYIYYSNSRERFFYNIQRLGVIYWNESWLRCKCIATRVNSAWLAGGRVVIDRNVKCGSIRGQFSKLRAKNLPIPHGIVYYSIVLVFLLK